MVENKDLYKRLRFRLGYYENRRSYQVDEDGI